MQHLPIHPTLCHPLTGKPLAAVGFSKRGPIWPIMGAAEDGDAGATDDAGGSDGDSNDGDGDGESGKDWKSEFEAQRRINRKLEKGAKPLFDALKIHGLNTSDAIALLSKPTPAGEDGEAVDVEKIQRDAESAATIKANARIVRAEVKAAASDTFADPSDAALYLDLTQFEVDDDGEIDADEIKSALKKVLVSKPHLAKTGKAPKADPSQGGKGDSQRADPGAGMPRLRQAYADTSK